VDPEASISPTPGIRISASSRRTRRMRGPCPCARRLLVTKNRGYTSRRARGNVQLGVNFTPWLKVSASLGTASKLVVTRNKN